MKFKKNVTLTRSNVSPIPYIYDSRPTFQLLKSSFFMNYYLILWITECILPKQNEWNRIQPTRRLVSCRGQVDRRGPLSYRWRVRTTGECLWRSLPSFPVLEPKIQRKKNSSPSLEFFLRLSSSFLWISSCSSEKVKKRYVWDFDPRSFSSEPTGLDWNHFKL